MKRFFTIFSIMIFAGQLFGQTSLTWYFGYQAGIKFNPDGSTVPAFGSYMNAGEGSTEVYDTAGIIMFYSDGVSLWNNSSPTPVCTNLLGGQSSTQAALAVPIPGSNCQKFLIFTTKGIEESGNHDLGVALVSVTGQPPNYIVNVSQPAMSVIQPPGVIIFAEKLAGISDTTGGYWILAHDYFAGFGNATTFYKYHITATEFSAVTTTAQAWNVLNQIQQTQSVGSNHNDQYPPDYNAQGQMKFTKNGQKLALVLAGSKTIDLFNFNLSTGTITPIATTDVNPSYGNLYGCEFSANGNVLYTSEGFASSGSTIRKLYQWDISNGSLSNPFVVTSGSNQYNTRYKYNGLDLGPTDKIYCAEESGISYLSVINNPESLGSACGWSSWSVPIANTYGLGLPDLIANYECVCLMSPGVITGPTPVCRGDTGQIYSVSQVPGATGYFWSVPPGVIITSGNNTTTIKVTFTATAVSGSFSVYAFNASCHGLYSPSFFVTVNPSPVPTISGPSPVCLNSNNNTYTTQPGMNNYTWSVSSGGVITSGGTATDNTVTISWIAIGAQTVSVNYHDPNGCPAANPAIFNVIVNALPVPTITGPSPVCLNSTETYITQTGMTNYIWSVSSGGNIISGGTATDNTVTISWTAIGAQTVSVNYHDPHGCTAANPAIFNVTVNALPVPTITGPSPVCLNSPETYITQTGMTNYIWSVSSGGTIIFGGTATDNTVTISWTTTGAQTVSVNYHNPNGCTAANPAIFNVTVNALPVPTITGPSPVCLNSTDTYITQTGMTNYFWSVSSGGTIIFGGTATDNTVTISWTAIGAQTVSVNYHDPNGCTAANPAIFNVTVNALPVPTITGPSPVCLNSSGNTYSTQPGMTSYIWSVSSGGVITSGGTATDNAVTITWTVSGAQTVSVNYYNSYGCTATYPAIYSVTVNPSPQPAITGPTPICINSTNNVYSTQAGMSDYIWSVSSGGTITAGGSATDSTITITWTASGSQNVSVNYYNPNGCTAANPAIFNVTVKALPVPTITGPSPVCLNSTETYITQTGMTNYIWSVSSGGTIISGGTATDNTVTITWIVAGPQTVGINYHDPYGCTAANPAVFNIYVNTLPLPVISGPNPVCLNSSENIYITQPGMFNYLWSVSCGGIITSGGSPFNNSITITWTMAGTQTISVNFHDLNGCSAPDPTVYNVIVNPLPLPTITGPTPVCFDSTNNIYSTQPAMTNYIWSASAGGTITSGGSETDNTITITWSLTGSQTVTVNYNTPEGCKSLKPAIFSILVNALPGPAGNITGPQQHCTATATETFSVDTISFATTYSWQLPPAFKIINGLGTNSITVSIDTSFISGDIYVYGINSCGDGALSLPFHFISQRSPVVDAGLDQSIPYNSNTKLNGSITGGSGTYSWLWLPSALLTEDTLLDPETVKLTHDTLFILMVTDLLNGCKGTDSVRIKVLNPEINNDCLVFHNVITPNGDGLNDKWIIDCIENFPDNKVIIFNRWGDIVNRFDHYDNISQVWKGTMKDGSPLPDGTYYYVLTIKSGGNYCGWILLRGNKF